MAGWFAKLAGIIGSTLQLDVVGGGPRLKNNAGVMEVRDAADAAYALARSGGVTLPVNQNDVRPWAAFAVNYFFDFTSGNDANPGTSALPFKTWNGGLWPAISALRYADVTVTQLDTAQDTSLNTSYVLPVGVSVTMIGPWADSGLGTLTSTGASSTSNIVVTGGGLAVNAWEGRRVRWLAGASNVGVYSIRSNTATAIIPGVEGLPSAPLNGNQFVIEKQTGGWKPSALATIDATAPGASLIFTGFKTDGTTASMVVLGSFHLAGHEHDCGGAGTNLLFRIGIGSLGYVHGGPLNVGDAVGSVAGLGCYYHNAAGAAGCQALAQANVRNLVISNVTYLLSGSTGALLNGLDVHGTTSQFDMIRGAACQVQNATQIGANTKVVFQVGGGGSAGGCELSLSSAVFDTTLAAHAIAVDQGYVTCSACTGVNATAAKFGIVATNGSRITNLGGNTVAGAAGAISLGAHAAQAVWPAAGTLVTDLADAAPQGCIQA